MKVYISMDMEGVAGVVHREQTNPLGYDYPYARTLMIGECNAAIEGCLDAGATEIVVSDSHGGNGFKTLLAEALHPAADLVTGMPRPFGQMAGLESSFDALMLVGYHTRHGAEGVLNHTLNGQGVARLTACGIEVGEIGTNAALAGHDGVPLVMVSGDDRTVAEAQALMPWVQGAVVKQAVSRYAERGLHPRRARAVIRAAAAGALRNLAGMKPWRLPAPVSFDLRFKDSGMAEVAAQMPGVERIDPCTLRIAGPDTPSVYAAYLAAVDLGMTSRR